LTCRSWSLAKVKAVVVPWRTTHLMTYGMRVTRECTCPVRSTGPSWAGGGSRVLHASCALAMSP
jgi:hypothetical protein